MSQCQFLFFSFLALVSLAYSPYATSHSGSTSYFELEVEEENDLRGDWYVALQDLDRVFGLDLDQDGLLSWGEFQVQEAKLVAYAQAHIRSASSRAECEVEIGIPALSQLTETVYARIPLRLFCPKDEVVLSVSYSAIFPDDLSHRAIVKIHFQAEPEDEVGNSTLVFVFSPDKQEIFIDVKTQQNFSTSFAMLKQGVIHILAGYDHLLFLLALLIPLTLKKGIWKGAKSRGVVLDLCKVISAFTLGHSITLVLATAFALRPPIALVESLIAASVIIAGINILWPLFRDSSWRIAIGFGLIHGFGFASVLMELDLSASLLATSLFTFNLGVELGQLLVVVLVLPVMILMTMKQATVLFARSFAALAIVSMGTFWLVERGF